MLQAGAVPPDAPQDRLEHPYVFTTNVTQLYEAMRRGLQAAVLKRPGLRGGRRPDESAAEQLGERDPVRHRRRIRAAVVTRSSSENELREWLRVFQEVLTDDRQ